MLGIPYMCITMHIKTIVINILKIKCTKPVNALPFWRYSQCLLNLALNPNKIHRLGKNLQNWENTDLFWIGKQPVFGCKIGKIKSL